MDNGNPEKKVKVLLFEKSLGLHVKGANVMNVQFFMLLYVALHPTAWIFYSGVFFWFVIKKLKPVKTVFYLKCYCVLIMPFAIEALIRSLIYVHKWSNAWGTNYVKYIFFLVIFISISTLVMCLCGFGLKNKYASLMTRKVYLCLALIMVTMILVFPYFSIIFEASLQIFSIWGGVATALYGLSRYAVTTEDTVMSSKKRILSNMLCLYILLPIWMWHMIDTSVLMISSMFEPYDYYQYYYPCVYALNYYIRSNPEAISELTKDKLVDITDRLKVDVPHVRIGAVSVVVKNNKYSMQHNVEACFFYERGVPSLGTLGHGAYCGIDEVFDVYKYRRRGKGISFNTPDLDSPYDGESSFLYRELK